MQNLSWAAPILPGKLEAWHRFNDEMHERHEEHTESRRDMGMHREVASLMHTPAGDFVCLYHEADDLAKAFQVLGTSQMPYLRWFREQLADIHGLSPEMLTGPPPAEVRFDWSAGEPAAHPNETLVREGYAAFGRADMDTLRGLFTEDVVWHYPGTSQFAGDTSGIDALLAWFGRSYQESGGTLQIELHDVLANGERAISLTTVRAEREGRRIEDTSTQVFRIVDGRVAEVWTQPGDLYATDAFWS
jgi:ketosteroid isomerase-like protein